MSHNLGVPITVIAEQLERAPPATAEHDQRAGHRLDGQENPHLRRDLNHRPRLQKAWASATRVPTSPGAAILTFAPVQSSSSIRQTVHASLRGGLRANSTKVRRVSWLAPRFKSAAERSGAGQTASRNLAEATRFNGSIGRACSTSRPRPSSRATAERPPQQPRPGAIVDHEELGAGVNTHHADSYLMAKPPANGCQPPRSWPSAAGTGRRVHFRVIMANASGTAPSRPWKGPGHRPWASCHRAKYCGGVHLGFAPRSPGMGRRKPYPSQRP